MTPEGEYLEKVHNEHSNFEDFIQASSTQKVWCYQKSIAKAGLDNATSSMCKHQQQFGLDVDNQATNVIFKL